MTQKLIQNLIHFLVALLSLFMISFLRPAFAGIDADKKHSDNPNLGEQYKSAAKELALWFKKEESEKKYSAESAEPDLGFYIENISFKDAYDLNYTANYGILVGSSRDWNIDGQLNKDDIIFEINGIRVKHRSHFENMLREKAIGDTINVKYFRDGQIFQKPLYIQSKQSSWDFPKRSLSEIKSQRGCGLGGAAYKPMYLSVDQTTLNNTLNSLGFNDLNNMSAVYHGFDFQGLVGNGYFVGGFGGWSKERQNTQINIDQDHLVSRNMKYRSGLGGVNFDKRYRLADRWILSSGLMIGGGGTQFEIDQLDGDIKWNQMDVDSVGSYNDYLKLKKNFFLVQPRVALMYRVLPVFWIKLEAGYMLSYSKNGWQTIVNDQKYDITDPAKDTSLNGLTISISPWFGF